MIYGLWYLLGILTMLALPYVARNQEMLNFLSTCVG